MRIRITRTPSGTSPEEVRQGWVGIILEYTTKVKARQMTDHDILIGRKKEAGYMVDAVTALQALERHNPKAYEWWINRYPNADFGNFVFTTNECEEVSQ
ncbi:MAG: hypothetical protein UT67_C0016G0012 [Candidatus Magasanikbacteria bacterium GW2011_GWA2_40_10]|uniref:Uncharacterized protein n=1 Tax=Candidatus Magasanikbacteria bacterium GW2011_GWA2_40_10 TaxID=1619037 RepID=A0A0G0SI93_9BACT|nr:MAG: hypothetical protein UT67_C0016G0012 [Candidatus Magasanikbacteria bacterium GW2011_GWA2_40_10]